VSVYLDYAATTPVDGRVVDAMAQCMRDAWANPSAAYSAAGAARREMRLARRSIARMLGCDHAALFFTSGGTESNTWAMRAAAPAAVSMIEHASVLSACPGAALIPPDENGVITPDAVERALTPQTRLVSVQWANNETGVIHPVADIGRMLRKRGVLFHVDAVQAFGHVPVSAACCDLMTISAHKLYGPRGAGCLYIRPGVALPPLLPGGGQESGRRGGTENTPAICGFRVAAELAEADMEARARQESALMDAFVSQIEVPGMRLLGARAPRLPGVTALYLPNLPSEKAIMKMDLRGFCLSGGAACHAGDGTPSHVYRAMGLSEKDAACVVRVSIGRGTTKQALAACAQALEEVWKQG